MDLMVDCEEVMVVESVLVNRGAVDATWLRDWRDQRCSGPGTSIDFIHILTTKWMALLNCEIDFIEWLYKFEIKQCQYTQYMCLSIGCRC